MRRPTSIEVEQFWVYRRARLPPVMHEVTLGIGLRHMLEGRDEAGYWVFLPREERVLQS